MVRGRIIKWACSCCLPAAPALTCLPLPCHSCLPAGSPHVTALDTAAAAGVPTSCVAKTMTLMVDHLPHLVVTRGDQRVDMHKARSHCFSSQHSSHSRPWSAHTGRAVGPTAAAAAGQTRVADAPAAAAAAAQGAGWLGGGCKLLRLQHTIRTARLPVAAAVKLLV
jgi:hypothetical protein